MCNYLHGPLSNGMYYFRRSIPVRLRPLFGKREFYFSLKTKDRETAKRLVIQVHSPKYQSELDNAEAMLATAGHHAPSRNRTNDEAGRGEAESAAANEAYWQRQDFEREARIEAQSEHARQLRIRITGSTADMAPEDAVIARLVREHEADAEFNKRLAKDREFALKEMREAAERMGHAPQPVPVRETNAHLIQTIASTPAVTLTGLFEGYGSQPGITQGTVRQWRSCIGSLVAFLKHDDAKRVTVNDLIDWREWLRTQTTRTGAPLSAKTINGSYLAAASVTFAYGLDRRLISDNPTLGVKGVRSDNKPKLRERDFTRSERDAILRAALTHSDNRLSRERALARRWVPWLCAYTGARVNELTQLRAEDVRQIDGVWTIHITPEAGSVKTNAARTIPLHAHLIEQGFLDIAKGKSGPLFLNPDKGRGGEGRHYKKVGMFLAEWVRNTVGISDPNVAPNHGWRHTFKTICREAEIEESAADYIQGHAHKGQGRRYGSNTLPALAKQLEKFPRFTVV